MGEIFTTLNPETGELTEYHEFANSWKWRFDKYSPSEAGVSKTPAASLMSKHRLNEKTPDDDVYSFHSLFELIETYRDSSNASLRKTRELLESLEVASIQIKDLKCF